MTLRLGVRNLPLRLKPRRPSLKASPHETYAQIIAFERPLLPSRLRRLGRRGLSAVRAQIAQGRKIREAVFSVPPAKPANLGP